MAKAWQQLSAPPLQEVVERVGGAPLYPDLIAVAPDLQARQRHPDLQRPVELKQRAGRFCWTGPERAGAGQTGPGLTQSTWLATSISRYTMVWLFLW